MAAAGRLLLRVLTHASTEDITMKARLPITTALCMLALLFSGPAVAGEVYKFVDAQGNVHYGDRPSGDPEEERLDVVSRATDPAAVQASVRLGVPKLDKEKCVAWANKGECRLCYYACPYPDSAVSLTPLDLAPVGAGDEHAGRSGQWVLLLAVGWRLCFR